MSKKFHAPLTLQTYSKKARAYVQTSIAVPDLDRLREPLRESLRGKTWRIARADRPLKVPAYRPHVPTSSGRSIADVQLDYANWAISKGLKSITVYADKPVMLGQYWGEVKRIKAEDLFAVEESHD
jgi:hypothetical protein